MLWEEDGRWWRMMVLEWRWMRIIVMKTMSSRAQPRSVDDNSDVDR